MGSDEAERLQCEIDEAIRDLGYMFLVIKLDSDADVLNLSTCADVRVQIGGDHEWRDFSIRGYRGLERLLHDEQLGRRGPEGDLHYCVGGPLCIVREITGRSIVKAVHHYYVQETGGRLPPRT